MPETPTPRLGLYRTASDGSENVNVLTDLNNNLDKLDTYAGFVSIPNQAARLATTGFVGLAVRQTDTGALYVLTALPASVAGNWLAVQTGTDISGPTVVANQAARDALVKVNGLEVWRTDRKWLEVCDGAAWRVQGVPIVTSVADLAAITNPVAGNVAWNTGDAKMYAYVGGAWKPQTPGRIVAFGNRGTDSTATTGEIGVLRIDNIPVVQGNRYWTTVSMNVYSTSTGDFVSPRVRWSNAGVATTSSTAFGQGGQAPINTFTGNGSSVSGSFVATATGSASVLLSVVRIAGSGNARTTGYVEMPIFDGGPDPTNTGVAV